MPSMVTGLPTLRLAGLTVNTAPGDEGVLVVLVLVVVVIPVASMMTVDDDALAARTVIEEDEVQPAIANPITRTNPWAIYGVNFRTSPTYRQRTSFGLALHRGTGPSVPDRRGSGCRANTR